MTDECWWMGFGFPFLASLVQYWILYSNISMYRGYSSCPAPSAWCCNDNGIWWQCTTLTFLNVSTVRRNSQNSLWDWVYTTQRQEERKSDKPKKVTLHALRARLYPSLSAGPNNRNMLGGISKFFWHWGPGLCNPDASLAGALQLRVQTWWVHEGWSKEESSWCC